MQLMTMPGSTKVLGFSARLAMPKAEAQDVDLDEPLRSVLGVDAAGTGSAEVGRPADAGAVGRLQLLAAAESERPEKPCRWFTEIPGHEVERLVGGHEVGREVVIGLAAAGHEAPVHQHTKKWTPRG